MLRILAAIAALCAIGAFAGFIILRDDNQWRDGDPRHVSRGVFRGAFIALVACCIIIGVCICSAVSAHARPSPYPVTSFEGDRFGARNAQLGPEVAKEAQRQRASKKLNRRATAAHRKRPPVSRKRWDGHPMPKPRPGTVERLSGVVAPLAAKAREIVANCGSEVISGIRHTYIAGTGGRLSLHASGRAVDIKGNPSCIYSHLRSWPGGVSTDYHARGIQHVHFSYAPGGPEWGTRFAHHRGGHRHRHKRHARRG